MNLDQALRQITTQKSEYFKWKNNIRYDQTRPKKTEEDFLKQIQRKTLNSFIAWERTAEYKQLLVLLLESQIADDMQEIYNNVSAKAKEGDEKSVKLFLQLQKEIISNAKVARKSFTTVQEEENEEEDDLILD